MKILDFFTEDEIKSFSSEEQEKLLKYYEEAKSNEEKLKADYLKDPKSLNGILYSLKHDYGTHASSYLEEINDPKDIALYKLKDEIAAKSFRNLWNDIMRSKGTAYYENGELKTVK